MGHAPRAHRSLERSVKVSRPKSDVETCFPFIVGCGRSGTTLLRAMLDSHPELAVPAETKFIARMGAARRRYERPSGFDAERFVADMFRRTALEERWELSRSDVTSVLRERPPADYADAVRRVFAAMAEQRGKTRYGNKTPIHVMTMPLLAEIFPEARFVHLIRDGRDVTLSYLETEFGPTTVVGGALHWRRHVSRGRATGRELGLSRYHEVKYEDLVAAPEAILRPICVFLGLPYDERMLTYHERAEELLGGVKLPQYHQGLRRPPDRHRSWKTEMDQSDVARFEAIAGRLLSALGYERALKRVPLDASIRANATAALTTSRRAAAATARRVATIRRLAG